MLLLPSYTHVVNTRLKNTYLLFDDEGNLIIKSPKVSQQYIETLLLKKAAWINRSKDKILHKRGKALNFSTNNELYFYGKAYPLVLEKHSKKLTKLHFKNESFVLNYNTYDESIFQRHIDNFYKEEAKKEIPNIVNIWSLAMNLKYKQISFRKTKRQWGSCSHANNLSFNTMLIKLPRDVIQYIVVHELAHIKHKHHKKSFWAEVACYLPDYKQQILELKQYTT